MGRELARVDAALCGVSAQGRSQRRHDPDAQGISGGDAARLRGAAETALASNPRLSPAQRPDPSREQLAAAPPRAAAVPARRHTRTRAGLPKAVAPAGTSRVTTLPAPISASSPMATPGRIIAPAPIHTLRPIRTGRPNSRPDARPAGSRG